MEKQRLTECESPSFCTCGDSKWAVELSWDDEKDAFGLNRCSNIAIIRNIDINIAVATKPKEIAFMDVPKLFHGPSLPTSVWDGLGYELP